MDWEQLAIRWIDSLTQAGLQFGTAYGNQWLAGNQLEAQLELLARYRPQAVLAPAASPLLLLLLIGGVVLLAKR